MTATTASYTISEYTRLDELPLECRACFDTAESLALDLGQPWHRNLVATVFADAAVRFIVAEKDNQPQAMLPVYFDSALPGRQREVAALSNYYSWLYAPLGPVQSSAVFAAMFAWLRTTYPKLDTIRLLPMDPDAASFVALEEALKFAGWRSFRFFSFGNWYLELQGQNWARYLASRSGEVRSTIKRKAKKFEARAGTLEIVSSKEGWDEALAAYQQVYAASWKQAEPYVDFIPGLVRTAAEQGWLRLGVARLDGQPIAAQIWLVAHGTANIYKLAYDERYASHSAGTLLTARLMQHVIEQDQVAGVDFLCGDDAYKPQWMSARRERWGLVAYNSGTVRGALLGVRERVGRCLKGPLPRNRTKGLPYTVPAVVVGCCGHGLSIIRSLSVAGVPVVALESNPNLPGVHTRLARVELVPDINGSGLIDALLALRGRLPGNERPVLFLANDRMVERVGSEWERLQDHYRLSWSHCRHSILALLDKAKLEAHCLRQGNAYPLSSLMTSVAAAEQVASAIGFPMIVKPTKPLSGFKTRIPGSVEQLVGLAQEFQSELPFVVQRFIPGDDRAIYFCALYLDQGRVLARFEGHKLRSRPLGHTTVAESFPDELVYSQALKFFEKMNLSGPLSLELKRDPEGRFWVIEPTVGRSDFWVSLCTENGINLPLTEYCHQLSIALPGQCQRVESIWFNEERDPFGWLWLASRIGVLPVGKKARFIYLHLNDPAVARRALFGILRNLVLALLRQPGKWTRKAWAGIRQA